MYFVSLWNWFQGCLKNFENEGLRSSRLFNRGQMSNATQSLDNQQ